MSKEHHLTKKLQDLQDIIQWLEEKGNDDIEESLIKVKKGVLLLKESKKRLLEIENTFTEIQKELEE